MRRRLSMLPGLALIAALVFGLGAYALYRVAGEPFSGAAHVARELGLHQLTDAKAIEDEDTHGGFHGDGERFIALQFDAKSAPGVREQLASSDRWLPLPMQGDCLTVWQGSLAGDAGAETGWWYCMDRQTGRFGALPDGADLYDKGSVNITAAVYDAEINALYYLEFDT